VDLITRNIPVPGIEEIPTTVLEPGSSKVDRTPRRKKPWEKDENTTEQDEATTSAPDTSLSSSRPEIEGTTDSQESALTSGIDRQIDVNGHRETGEGVVNILKPNAVPDSGLLAKE
jgi:hypothetical protein